MKADNPNAMPDAALTAYGRAAIVERHLTVLCEEKTIIRLHFAHAVRVLPAIRAKLDKIGKR
jgi:hypothetical protein